ncbi:low molecular weight phosphatase family protein [Alteromonas ponticola]|uniref:protein-tyrosine-phosphatase n=1 Tax=Alteromonas ponticola TaxID=2720613 RepID=A0ABX1QYX7_9ALTE|nr:hypothetical protein [Alteromonas ponticola]NMH59049.1 hypothetical protein [Alteromonas ponticola]
MLNVSQKIADEFGSKRGLLRFLVFGIKNSFGHYKKATKVDLRDVRRLVFICSGNICRSPFGEEVSKVNDFEAVSYGLHCRGGDPAFEKTLHFSKELGYDLHAHRSQHISNYEPKTNDLLVVMEPAHLLELERLFPESKKVLIGILSSQRTVYLHDPYNTNDYFFLKCLRSIEIATKKLITQVGNQK